MSELELPRLAPMRARERPFLVSEQLGLEQFGGERSAVHLHEGLVEPSRDLMNGTRDHFLAHPALSREQYRHVGIRGSTHDVLDGAHPLAASEEEIEVVGRSITFGDGGGRQVDRSFLSVLGEATMDRVPQDLQLDRFDEEVTRSCPHCFDGKPRIICSRQHHERGLRTLEPKLVQEVQHSRLGVVDVQHDGLRSEARDEGESVGQASYDHRRVANLLDASRDKIPTLKVAADDENSVGGHRA